MIQPVARGRWFTCTPKDFVGNSHFFNRDNGLLCRGLNAIGVESKAILLGPPRDDDFPEILRASWAELISAKWWRTHRIDGVALLSWGQPRYRVVLDAIRDAGCRVVHFTDTNGLISPLVAPLEHLQIQFAYHWDKPLWQRIGRTILSLPSGWLMDSWMRDPYRARMIAAADAFCAATPRATRRYRRLTRIFQGSGSATKVHHLPFPVSFHFGEGTQFEKQDLVVAVGRWESSQKRAPLLADTILITAKARPSSSFHIFGHTGDYLDNWHRALAPDLKDRILLRGLVPNEQLAATFRKARVMLVSAAYEGCHVSSAEAVCSGASIVCCHSPLLDAVEWHSSLDSGRTANRSTSSALATALIAELDYWDQGKRNPLTIASSWRAVFMPDRVATKLLEIAGMPDLNG